MELKLEVETRTHRVWRRGHIHDVMIVEMHCKEFTRVLVIVQDDRGRTQIFDGDIDHLVDSTMQDVELAKEAIRREDYTEAILCQHRAELKRDVISALRNTIASLRAAPLPHNAASVHRATQLWEGYVFGDYYHILGHEDGKVSFLLSRDLGSFYQSYQRSPWPCVTHHVPANALQVVVPTLAPNASYAAMTVRIETHTYHPPQQPGVEISLRAACDQVNGVWIKVEEPFIGSIGRRPLANGGAVKYPNKLPQRGSPFGTLEEFVDAVVDASKLVV